jgi:hypothetical protein
VLIGIIVAVVILAVVMVLMLRARKGTVGGPVMLSHLKCPKCNTEFDYAYLPGASFTSLRLGNSRLLQCPECHKWSTFNLSSTRVDPKTHHCERRIGPS